MYIHVLQGWEGWHLCEHVQDRCEAVIGRFGVGVAAHALLSLGGRDFRQLFG